MRPPAALALAIGLMAASFTAAMAQSRTGTAGDFDYYILALSWSPTYCSASERNASSEQCRENHDVVLHGLWPQYRHGWPQFCSTSHPLRLPARLLDRYDAMTPDRGLLAHQWRKHGVCTGLSPEDYFALAERLWERVRMPPPLSTPRREASFPRGALKDEIVAANPDMAPDMLVLTCEGRRLDEIRICYDREGALTTCGADVLADACRHSPMLVLPVRQR